MGEHHVMSETSTEPTTDATDQAQQGDPAADLGDAGKKALAAERRRAEQAEKDAKALKSRLDAIEAEKLSDLERAQKQAQEFQQAAEKANAESLRWRVAAQYGISADDAETFLTGADEATLTRQAERLTALAKTPTTPKPDLSQGGKETIPALNSDALERALRDKLGIA